MWMMNSESTYHVINGENTVIHVIKQISLDFDRYIIFLTVEIWIQIWIFDRWKFFKFYFQNILIIIIKHEHISIKSDRVTLQYVL